MLREVQQERYDLADLVHVELVLEQVVHAVDELLLLLDHGVADLLEGEQDHVVRLRQKVVDEAEELVLYLLLEVNPDLLVTAENQPEHYVVELVQDKEAEEVFMLGNVLEEANYELEEAIQLELALFDEHIHN